MIEIHQPTEFSQVSIGQGSLASTDDVTDRRDGIGCELVFLGELAHSRYQCPGIAGAAIVSDHERKRWCVDRPTVCPLDADGPTSGRTEGICARSLTVLDRVLDLIRALCDFCGIENRPKFPGRCIDRRDYDCRRGTQSGTQWNITLNLDVDPDIRTTGRIPRLIDCLVDVAHSRLDESVRDIYIWTIRRIALILDREAIEG